MILFLAGTSDARELAIEMKQVGFEVLATVVTASAAKSLQDEGISTRIGRLTAEDMTSLISEKGFQAVVDASHPFAEEASKNALNGAKAASVPYIRYERESQRFQNDKLIVVRDYEEASKLAAAKRGASCLRPEVKP